MQVKVNQHYWIEKGCGFWDVTHHAYGMCFRRATVPVAVKVTELVDVGNPGDIKAVYLHSTGSVVVKAQFLKAI